MKKSQILLLSLVCLFTFILIYIPHYANPLPVHIDEWHHIEEALKLQDGIISGGYNSRELGFHLILAFLGYFFDLVKIYRFLPGLFAIISSLTLFFIVKKLTKDNKKSFYIALFSMIFFLSIKSNVNILGPWFFTPLTFSIPFIFLYMYLFKEGLDNDNKKYIIYSLIIMIFLVFIHALSVLFSFPILIIYGLFNHKKIKNNLRFYSLFLLIPSIGIIFFSMIMKNPLAIIGLIKELTFRYGWGVYEINNSPFELYPLIGYILAIISIVLIIYNKKKEYYFYILWLITLLASIIIFRLTGFSFFSPYQRNLFYLTLSLPLLSALGLIESLSIIKKNMMHFKLKENTKAALYKSFRTILIILVLFFAFNSYFAISDNIKLYKLIDDNDYDAIMFIKNSASGTVMAPLEISTTIYPLAKRPPYAVLNFYGYSFIVEEFFSSNNCTRKEEILLWTNSSYILSKHPLDCNYTLIYDKGDYVYSSK